MNDYISRPVTCINGVISLPGDKSISHRAVIFSVINHGITTIKGFLESADCMATINAFKAMGVKIEGPRDSRVTINGVGRYGIMSPGMPIDCGNSGTTMRLLAGLLVGQKFPSVLIGDASLSKRPMQRIVKPLSMMDANIQVNHGLPPIKITPVEKLSGIHYKMIEASAQVKSSILLAGLYSSSSTSIVEPVKTRDHTENMLKLFSCPIIRDGMKVTIDGCELENQKIDVIVPGDISTAAFFMVAASIVPNSEILLKGVGINPTRTGIITILKAMGADIAIANESYYGYELVGDITVKSAQLHGINIPQEQICSAIDEFPIILIAAAAAYGQTTLRNAQELRVKESDRISAMSEGLKKLGVKVHEYSDGISITGGEIKGGSVSSFGDHRIAMAFSIAGLVAKDSVTITNCECVKTSTPNFINLANKLQCNILEKQYE